ncbi:hypothetical protein [uncultured Kordia sp.]|uniref:hypothetical protein n=1 Tax=uncultured Kordia sp. TaxID=507699 RepID=UPI0026222BCD|nr:hypothetical protein [uncultured Kordia sp.]
MKTNATFISDDTLEVLQQKNLVYNYNFLNFSNRGTAITPDEYGHPDGWIYKASGSGAMIGLDESLGACRIKKSADDSEVILQQNISEFPRWEQTLKNKTISAEIVITNQWTDAFEITVELSDGVTTSSTSNNISSDQTNTIRLQHKFDSNATTLVLAIRSSTQNAEILIQKAYANIGNFAMEALPCMVNGFIGERKQYLSTETAPATEISLCEATKKLSEYNGSYTRLSSFLNGRFGGDMEDSFLPDMRGYFSRVWDNGAKTDPNADERLALGEGTVEGDHVGTVEEDIFEQHTHELKYDTVSIFYEKGSPTYGLDITKTSETEVAGKDNRETRPKNISELYTMKWA